MAAAAGLLLVVCVTAYGNSLGVGFLLDNEPIILKDFRLRTFDWRSISDIFRFNYWYPTFESDLFRPLTTLSYAFNYSALGGGEDPTGYHLVNLFLHWANAVLTFVLVREMGGRHLAALFTAAVLTCHPLTVESVTNIVGRADLLAALSILIGLLSHRRYLRGEGRGKRLWLAVLAIACLGGVFSKENAVVLPALMLLNDVAFELRGERAWFRAVARHARHAWRAHLAIVPGMVMLAWARWTLLHGSPIAGQHGADNPIAMADSWTGLMTAVKVLGYYLALFVWPSRLSCDYSYNQVTLFGSTFTGGQDIHAWLALAITAAMFAAAVFAWLRHQRAIFFFLGFAAVCLMPTANLAFPIGTIMAERFMYLPLAGLTAACALALSAAGEHWLAAAAPSRRRTWSRAAAVAAIVLVMALAVRTAVRNRDWASDYSLWASAARAAPNSYRVHMALASIVMESDPSGGRVDEAIGESDRALEIVESGELPLHHRPLALYVESGWYRLRRAQLLADRGESGSARAELDRALATLRHGEAIDREINRRARETLIGRGWREADIHHIGNATLYRNIGSAHLLRGEQVEAVAAFSYMQRIAPRNDDAHYARGLAEAAAGQRERDGGNEIGAIERMETAAVNLIVATLLNPNNEPAWQVLSKVYEQFETRSPAVLDEGASSRLDLGEPLVSRHFQRACAQLVQQLFNAGLSEDAAAWRDRMVHEYGLPSELLAVPAAVPPA